MALVYGTLLVMRRDLSTQVDIKMNRKTAARDRQRDGGEINGGRSAEAQVMPQSTTKLPARWKKSASASAGAEMFTQ